MRRGLPRGLAPGPGLGPPRPPGRPLVQAYGPRTEARVRGCSVLLLAPGAGPTHRVPRHPRVVPRVLCAPSEVWETRVGQTQGARAGPRLCPLPPRVCPPSSPVFGTTSSLCMCCAAVAQLLLSRYPFLLRDESRSWLGLQCGLVVGCLCLPRWVNGKGWNPVCY